MGGITRVDCTGHIPVIEYRGDWYFVCFPKLNVELVMAFEHKITAREIGTNVCAATPFFTLIPVVPYQTPYPRPWLIYPDTRIIRDQVDLRVVDTGTTNR